MGDRLKTIEEKLQKTHEETHFFKGMDMAQSFYFDKDVDWMIKEIKRLRKENSEDSE